MQKALTEVQTLFNSKCMVWQKELCVELKHQETINPIPFAQISSQSVKYGS
jgi:hypothetical protein